MTTRSSGSRGSSSFVPIDYYRAVIETDEARVPLSSGRELTIRRAGLGRHFYLRRLSGELTTGPLEERVGRLRAWLELAGVALADNGGKDGEMEPAVLGLADLAPTIRAIKELNAPRGQMAWSLVWQDDEAPEELSTEYGGRDLARVVDTLARHYGWSLERILELSPEAAMAHVQECILADHRQRTWEHYLSEVAWEYDRGSGRSRYRPLPALPWERPKEREYGPVPEWIKEKYYPKGVVIDLGEVDLEKENGRAAGPRE